MTRIAQFEFGTTGEWDDFSRRNVKFIEIVPKLRAVVDRFALVNNVFEDERMSAVYFHLWSCREHFFEILMLAGNGFGGAAQARLRTMYERLVYAAFFLESKEGFRDYRDYDWIQRKKLYDEAQRLFPNIRTRAEVAEFETKYEAVASRFMSRKGKLKQTWAEMGFPDIAKTTGMGGLYLLCYLIPTQFVHPNPMAILSRIRDGEYDWGPQRQIADEALSHAHTLLIIALQLLNKVLHSDLQPELKDLQNDCSTAWLHLGLHPFKSEC